MITNIKFLTYFRTINIDNYCDTIVDISDSFRIGLYNVSKRITSAFRDSEVRKWLNIFVCLIPLTLDVTFRNRTQNVLERTTGFQIPAFAATLLFTCCSWNTGLNDQINTYIDVDKYISKLKLTISKEIEIEEPTGNKDKQGNEICNKSTKRIAISSDYDYLYEKLNNNPNIEQLSDLFFMAISSIQGFPDLKMISLPNTFFMKPVQKKGILNCYTSNEYNIIHSAEQVPIEFPIATSIMQCELQDENKVKISQGSFGGCTYDLGNMSMGPKAIILIGNSQNEGRKNTNKGNNPNNNNPSNKNNNNKGGSSNTSRKSEQSVTQEQSNVNNDGGTIMYYSANASEQGGLSFHFKKDDILHVFKINESYNVIIQSKSEKLLETVKELKRALCAI